MDFNRMRLVAKREWLTRLRQRSFQITTVVQVLFVAIGASVPTIVALFSDDDGAMTDVLIVDETGANIADRLAPYIVPGDSAGFAGGGDTIELIGTELTAAEVVTQIDEGTVDAALIVSRSDNGDLSFTYVSDAGDSDSIAQQLYAGAAGISFEDRLERSGVDQAEFEEAAAAPAFTIDGLGEAGEADSTGVNGAEVAVAYFFTILMFMTIMLYGTWVATGVVEEKSSRIMEIMINAATPRDLLAGKVLGIGLAGLTQLLPMLMTGGVLFALQKPIAETLGADTSALPNIDFGAISVGAIGWFMVYFLLGFTLYAAMYAALGSLVSRQEEVNQAVSPMMTVMFVGYFAAFFTMWSPDSLLARVLSIFPLTAPFVMISRVIVSTPPAWEMALSVLLLAGVLVAALLFAARVYRIGVLQYGQKPSWKALFGKTLEQTAR